jgi:hypothetical protein
LVDFSAVLAYTSPFLISPFKPCMPFSGTRLNDDLLGVACAGYFTVPDDTKRRSWGHLAGLKVCSLGQPES